MWKLIAVIAGIVVIVLIGRWVSHADLAGLYAYASSVFHTRDPGTVIFSSLAFLFFAGLIWNLTGVLNDAGSKPEERAANRLVALLGALVGWIIGIVFAPFSAAEKAQFVEISSVVSAFFSGYIVSKLDRFLEGTLFANPANPNSWTRVGLFIASLLLASVLVFVNRLYAFQDTFNAACIRDPAACAPTGVNAPKPDAPARPAATP